MSIFSELGIREDKGRIHEELLYNLAACYSLIEQEIEKFLSFYNLSPVKMNALLMIKHVGKGAGLSQAEICKRMIVSAGNITRLVDRLERERLVERTDQKGDRRVNFIKITKKGSDLLNRVWPVYRKKVDEIVSLLPRRDVGLVTGRLNHLRERVLKLKGA